MKKEKLFLLFCSAAALSFLTVSSVEAGDYGSGYGGGYSGGYNSGYSKKSYGSDHYSEKKTYNEDDGGSYDGENQHHDADVDEGDVEEEVVVRKSKRIKDDPTNLRAN